MLWCKSYYQEWIHNDFVLQWTRHQDQIIQWHTTILIKKESMFTKLEHQYRNSINFIWFKNFYYNIYLKLQKTEQWKTWQVTIIKSNFCKMMIKLTKRTAVKTRNHVLTQLTLTQPCLPIVYFSVTVPKMIKK